MSSRMTERCDYHWEVHLPLIKNSRSYLRVLSVVWELSRTWEMTLSLTIKWYPVVCAWKVPKHILDCFLFQIIWSTSFSEIVLIPADDGCNGNGAAGAVDVIFSHQPELTSTTATTTAWERRTRRTQSQHCHWGGEMIAHFRQVQSSHNGPYLVHNRDLFDKSGP